MSDKNFVQESLHIQAVLLDESYENFIRHVLSDKLFLRFSFFTKNLIWLRPFVSVAARMLL